MGFTKEQRAKARDDDMHLLSFSITGPKGKGLFEFSGPVTKEEAKIADKFFTAFLINRRDRLEEAK